MPGIKRQAPDTTTNDAKSAKRRRDDKAGRDVKHESTAQVKPKPYVDKRYLAVATNEHKQFKKRSTDEGTGKVPRLAETKPAPYMVKELLDCELMVPGWRCIQTTDESTPVAQNSKEAHAKQRVLAKERKAAKPNADSILRAKKLWERLRLKSHVPVEERKTLVQELFEIITGRVKEFVFKHDSVRAVQCALKYANPEQRKSIAKELQGEYRTLAESRYAKFLVGKILVGEDAETRAMVISEFYGHVRRLINHPEASWILDDTYRQIASQEQKAILLREWYGPEFAIFKRSATDENPSAILSNILTASPEKRKPIMTHLFNLINQLVQKKLTGFTMLHDAMLQYDLNTGDPSTSESAEFLELIKGDEEGDLLKNLAFTKSGARVVCRALATSTAKDRKNILKIYKDNIETLVYDPNGHLVLLAAYEVVDDTVMTAKLVFPELLATKLPSLAERQNVILAHANHVVGRVALLYLFASDKPKWLIPDSSDAAAIIREARVLRTATSKKDPAARKTELAKALSGYDNILLSTVASRAQELISTSFGCQFVTEVLLSAEGDKTAAMEAVAELAKGDPKEEGHVARNGTAGWMLKTLVVGGRFDAATKRVVKLEPGLGFGDVLYERIKGYLVDWAVGESSFAVVNLVEDEGFRDRMKVKEVLEKDRRRLEEAKRNGNKGAGMLLDGM